jgi:segregation and condensation protein A
MKKIKDDDVIDFLTAGKLVKMAWNVLKLKSEDMLVKIEEKEENEICEVEFDIPSNFLYDFDTVYEEPYDFDFTSSVLEEPPFSEPVRRDEIRPVALIELIDAFEEAKIEMELNKKIGKKIKEKITLNLSEKIHKENLEEEINEIWNRLCDIDKEDILYSEVHNGTKEDAVKTFVSLLFLAFKRKVRLFQNDSYGEIHIELLVPEGLKKMEWEAVNVACVES